MDEDRHQVWRDGEEVDLSPTEFRLLRYFLLNPERVLSKQQILDHVWQYDFNGEDNVVETYVSYLRRKLDLPSRGCCGRFAASATCSAPTAGRVPTDR